MGLKEKIKREVHFMKVGAKVLPSVVGKKVTGYMQAQFEAAKQDAILQKEARAEAKIAAGKVYKEELVKLETAKAIKKAQDKAQGKGGFFGILGQLGAAGDRIDMADMLGMGAAEQRKPMGSIGEYIMPTGSGQSRREGKVVDIDIGGAILGGQPRMSRTRPEGMHSSRVIHRHRIVQRRRRK